MIKNTVKIQFFLLLFVTFTKRYILFRKKMCSNIDAVKFNSVSLQKFFKNAQNSPSKKVWCSSLTTSAHPSSSSKTSFLLVFI